MSDEKNCDWVLVIFRINRRKKRKKRKGRRAETGARFLIDSEKRDRDNRDTHLSYAKHPIDKLPIIWVQRRKSDGRKMENKEMTKFKNQCENQCRKVCRPILTYTKCRVTKWKPKILWKGAEPVWWSKGMLNLWTSKSKRSQNEKENKKADHEF